MDWLIINNFGLTVNKNLAIANR